MGFRDVRALKVYLDLLDQLDCKVHLEFMDFPVEKGKKEWVVHQEHLVAQVGDQSCVTKDKLVHLVNQDHQASLDGEAALERKDHLGGWDLQALESKDNVVSLVHQAFRDAQAFRDLQDSKGTMETLEVLDQRVCLDFLVKMAVLAT